MKNLFKTVSFIDEAKKIREKYGFPIDGFENEEQSRKAIKLLGRELRLKLINDCEMICPLFGLNKFDYSNIKNFVLYNCDEVSVSPFTNLCVVDDNKDLSLLDCLSKDEYEKYLDACHAEFPIDIKISPYASLRDILDFVKKSYKEEILPLQIKYRDKRNKIGKVKKRDAKIVERNDFIYSKRHLSYKEISALLNDKYNGDDRCNVGEGEIGKIISLENKRRNEM